MTMYEVSRRAKIEVRQSLPTIAQRRKTSSMSSNEPEPNRPRGRPTIENPATHHIHLRVTPKRKSAYVRAAHPKGLSDWMVENLDKAARDAGQEPEPPKE